MGAPRVSTALFGREKTKHSRQGPRQEELSGPRRQGPGKRSLPGRPSQSIETPARGVCRECRSRLKVTSLTRDPDKRGLPGRLEDYITGDTPRRYMRPGGARGATSFRARQVPGPGEVKTPARHLPGRVVLCAYAPAHRTTRRTGAIPGTRGGWLCSLGDTVALHGGEAIAVASGDARAGAFGVDGDGH